MEPQTAQQIHETLYDGADLQVTLINGSKAAVKVRKISRKDFPAFANTIGSEDLEAGFYLGDPALVGQLTEESFDAVMEEGRRLNFTRFGNWFRRQYQMLGVVNDANAMDAALALVEKSPALKTLLERTKS